jgi:hypothetical protein
LKECAWYGRSETEGNGGKFTGYFTISLFNEPIENEVTNNIRILKMQIIIGFLIFYSWDFIDSRFYKINFLLRIKLDSYLFDN